MSLRVNKTLSAVGLALIASALLWHFVLAERWTQRIPPGWSFQGRYTGTLTFADPAMHRLPERDEIGEYERSIRVMSDTGRPRSVLLEDRYTIRDARTQKVSWEYVTTAAVDPRTGAHVAPPYAGDVALFPRNVAKRTYVMRGNYLKGIPLAFEKEDVIDGLRTYLFAYRGRAEYSEAYAGTTEYEGVKLAPGQDIRCAEDQFYYRAWVEPTTGALVRLEEGCPSADSVFDTTTGRLVYPLIRWTGVTMGNDLLQRTSEVHRLRWRYLLASRYVPLALLASGVVLLGLGLRGRSPEGVA